MLLGKCDVTTQYNFPPMKKKVDMLHGYLWLYSFLVMDCDEPATDFLIGDKKTNQEQDHPKGFRMNPCFRGKYEQKSIELDNKNRNKGH